MGILFVRDLIEVKRCNMNSRKKLIRLTTVSRSLSGLLKGQLAFLSHYYEVIGVASGEDGLEVVSTREGIRTINVEMHREISPWNDLQSLWELIKLFHKERPYIVHANTPKVSLLSMMAAWITRVPHRIYTVTGLRFETTSGNFRRLLMAMERLTCQMATKVIPEGEGVKKTLLKFNITRKPLKVILNGNINGVDMDYYSRYLEIEEKAHRIKNKDFTFIFVGRLVRDKGVNELVRAFVRLLQEKPNVRLLLVGSLETELDPLEKETQQLMEQCSQIIMPGFQSDVRPFFAASDALAFPSYREGFPNVVLQAGAMGLPSIVTDINGCNEIVKEGVNGKIIPPRDEQALYEAMKWFYDHQDDEVKKMAENARPMIAERYEQHKVWEALLKEYQSL